MIIIEAILVILAVDFISGLVHWAEDTFSTESTPVIGNWIVKPNVLHHHDGSAFVSNTWLQSSWDLLAACILILGVAWLCEALTWHVWLFVVLGANANQIHKWNHMPRHKTPVWVRMLRQVRLLQSPAHHSVHHRDDKNRHYCVITNALNPVLDGIGWWRGLERILTLFWDAPRREDLRVKGWYG